jgi:tRNA-splicing ligase RtcB
MHKRLGYEYKPITVFAPDELGVETNAYVQLIECMKDERAVAGALMADHHLGYSMPIGGVIAYDNAISPSGVGFDIACGNKAVKTNLTGDDLPEIKPIMREIQKTLEFGIGRSNATPVDHALFDDDSWTWIEKLSPGLKDKARAQLGTVGSGNHYVDLLLDEGNTVWVANHFGSRGFGHTLATGFLNLAAGRLFGARGKADSEEPTVLGLDTTLGQSYKLGMQLAGDYAYAGRDYVIDQVLGILGATAVETVHNHHNFAWEENGLWIVRKGATPLTSEPAFIGGSMGDVSVIVRGKRDGCMGPRDERCGDRCACFDGAVVDTGNIGSAPHGAGRVMSRTKAAGKFKKVTLESGRRVRVRDASTGLIDWDATRADLTARGIVVLGAGADEAPGVYKPLQPVIAAHPNIEVLEILHPIGVVMAGPDEYDPYKD